MLLSVVVVSMLCFCTSLFRISKDDRERVVRNKVRKEGKEEAK